MADPPDIRLRRVLNDLGEELAGVRDHQGQVMGAIAKTAAKAVEAGITKAEIAERAQISRPTLDRLLAER